MKTQAILKSTINVKRINHFKPKISQSEKCLNKAKAKREKAVSLNWHNNQHIYYEIPSWM